jgi:hypothetical protein
MRASQEPNSRIARIQTADLSRPFSCRIWTRDLLSSKLAPPAKADVLWHCFSPAWAHSFGPSATFKGGQNYALPLDPFHTAFLDSLENRTGAASEFWDGAPPFHFSGRQGQKGQNPCGRNRLRQQNRINPFSPHAADIPTLPFCRFDAARSLRHEQYPNMAAMLRLPARKNRLRSFGINGVRCNVISTDVFVPSRHRGLHDRQRPRSSRTAEG